MARQPIPCGDLDPRDPNRCCRAAQAIIDHLKLKWKPSACENIDGLSLTPTRKLRNQDARNNNQKTTFDLTIARDGDLKSYFRIFAQPNATCHNPALRPMQLANMIRNRTTVYIDGARSINDIGEISAGSGVWYAPEDERNTDLKYKTDTNSNCLGELLAVLWVINNEPPHSDLVIKTKSKYITNVILDGAKKWEPTGYIGVKNKDIIRAIIAALRG